MHRELRGRPFLRCLSSAWRIEFRVIVTQLSRKCNFVNLRDERALFYLIFLPAQHPVC